MKPGKLKRITKKEECFSHLTAFPNVNLNGYFNKLKIHIALRNLVLIGFREIHILNKDQLIKAIIVYLNTFYKIFLPLISPKMQNDQIFVFAETFGSFCTLKM